MAAEDLHYYDDAKERVMVYPGARSSLPDGATAVVLLFQTCYACVQPTWLGCLLQFALWTNCPLLDQI